MPIINILDADTALLVTTEAAVNANLATFVPPLPPVASGDIIIGCVQVGMNALTKNYDEPNDATFLPLLSIVGLPFHVDNVPFPAELEARITAVATALSVTDAAVYNLALHAGVLTMNAIGPNRGYRPSFV
jgi:hypothetical protein